jgi:hypothetical protein
LELIQSAAHLVVARRTADFYSDGNTLHLVLSNPFLDLCGALELCSTDAPLYTNEIGGAMNETRAVEAIPIVALGRPVHRRFHRA